MKLTGDVTVGEVTTLTNTRVPDTVSVGVRKIWNDAAIIFSNLYQ